MPYMAGQGGRKEVEEPSQGRKARQGNAKGVNTKTGEMTTEWATAARQDSRAAVTMQVILGTMNADHDLACSGWLDWKVAGSGSAGRFRANQCRASFDRTSNGVRR